MVATEKTKLRTYYHSIANFILPYIKERPLTLFIKPKGSGDEGIYLKNMRGRKIEKSKIFIDQRKHPIQGKSATIEYLVCNDEETLQYIIGLGCIDIHPWNATVHSPECPDYIVIDIDPSDSNFFKVVAAAKAVKFILSKYGLAGFPKTSGKTGMHIFIPCSGISFHDARLLAEKICSDAHKKLPQITTTERIVSKRGNAVYLDPSQNDRTDTVAAVYSVRPVHNLTVSTPIEWKELTKKLAPNLFNMETVKKRLTKKGDLFSGIFDKKIIAANNLELKKILLAQFIFYITTILY